MRILLATDGSPCAEVAVREVWERPWPRGTEVKVLTVVDTSLSSVVDPALAGDAVQVGKTAEEAERAGMVAEQAAARIREHAPELSVAAECRDGDPKQAILQVASEWGADLIRLGSHGYGPARRFVPGLVALSTLLHAPCSVELVRIRDEAPTGAPGQQ